MTKTLLDRNKWVDLLHLCMISEEQVVHMDVRIGSVRIGSAVCSCVLLTGKRGEL